MPFYAVAEGRQTGIYNNWEDCKNQVHGYSRPVFKKFNTQVEAEAFVRQNGSSSAGGYGGAGPSTSTANPSYGNVSRPIMRTDYVHSEAVNSMQRNRNGDPVVYTDGACASNGQHGARAGIGVFWGNNHPDNVSRPLEGKPTNNRAEIEAARVAIETAVKNGHRTLEIRTDSQFMIDSMTKWMDGWKRNGWKLSNGGPVKNYEDWMRLDAAKSQLDRLVWTKVPGHSGNYGNEQADRLAIDSIKR